MKKYSKYFSVQMVMLIVFSCLPFLALAQPGDPGDCPECPIDGGLSFLIIAGVGYGIKKIKDSRKQKEIEA